MSKVEPGRLPLCHQLPASLLLTMCTQTYITSSLSLILPDLLVLGVRHASEAAAHLAPKIAFQIIAAASCAVLTVSS